MVVPLFLMVSYQMLQYITAHYPPLKSSKTSTQQEADLEYNLNEPFSEIQTSQKITTKLPYL